MEGGQDTGWTQQVPQENALVIWQSGFIFYQVVPVQKTNSRGAAASGDNQGEKVRREVHLTTSPLCSWLCTGLWRSSNRITAFVPGVSPRGGRGSLCLLRSLNLSSQGYMAWNATNDTRKKKPRKSVLTQTLRERDVLLTLDKSTKPKTRWKPAGHSPERAGGHGRGPQRRTRRKGLFFRCRPVYEVRNGFRAAAANSFTSLYFHLLPF